MEHQRQILCIEDDLDTCELVIVSLGMVGYQVKAAHSIKDGLAWAKQENFSLYSIDNRLPDGSGVDLCRLIREFDSQTPIIFYSGDAFPDDRDEALAAGAQAYLVKPTDPDELTKTVKDLLNNH
jgi:DNA-binding response OmpR family regulator